jgi:hypothetical protein
MAAEFYDAAVSGTDPYRDQAGLLGPPRQDRGQRRSGRDRRGREPLRDLVTQEELGIVALNTRGVRSLTASGDDLTETTDPFEVAIRSSLRCAASEPPVGTPPRDIKSRPAL